MKENYIGYIYMTINMKTGEKYIGKHKDSDFDYYFGSGSRIKKELSDDFMKVVLKYIYKEEDYDRYERELIRLIDTDYNIHLYKDRFKPIKYTLTEEDYKLLEEQYKDGGSINYEDIEFDYDTDYEEDEGLDEGDLYTQLLDFENKQRLKTRFENELKNK